MDSRETLSRSSESGGWGDAPKDVTCLFNLCILAYILLLLENSDRGAFNGFANAKQFFV